MNGQRNNGEVLHEQDPQLLHSASSAYLVEAALDREWKENYRNGNSRRTAHARRAPSRRMRTETSEASIQKGSRA